MPNNAEAFFMPIDEVLVVKGHGTVISGTIQRGTLSRNQNIEIIGLDQIPIQTKAKSFLLPFDIGADVRKGDRVGIVLRDADATQIKRGMVAVAPGSISAHDTFKVNLYLLSPEEGGRNSPIPLVVGYSSTGGYRPQFFIWNMDFACAISHPNPKDIDYYELRPGEKADLILRLLTNVPIEAGFAFQIRQGSQITGQGVVIEVLEDRY